MVANRILTFSLTAFPQKSFDVLSQKTTSGFVQLHLPVKMPNITLVSLKHAVEFDDWIFFFFLFFPPSSPHFLSSNFFWILLCALGGPGDMFCGEVSANIMSKAWDTERCLLSCVPRTAIEKAGRRTSRITSGTPKHSKTRLNRCDLPHLHASLFLFRFVVF